MSPYSILQEGRLRRRSVRLRPRPVRPGRPPVRPRGRRGLKALGVLLLVVVLCLAALLVFMDSRASEPGARARRGAHAAVSVPVRSDYGIAMAPSPSRFQMKQPLRSGLLFDVGTGQVLWQRAPETPLPIASLTKMMTALVVTAHVSPSAKALITPQVVHFTGSGMGVLPLHKRVLVSTLLYGLLLPSGNDAAIALAQRVAGTQQRFVTMMNQEAASLGLRCTHFSNVSGIVDNGNYSCASDLALMAHLVLEQPLLARIVGSTSAVEPLPVKSGHVWLYNNNPLYTLSYAGTDGVKTGYTTAAGHCLVATVRRGTKWLGIVLLNAPDSGGQGEQLLNAGFADPSA